MKTSVFSTLGVTFKAYNYIQSNNVDVYTKVLKTTMAEVVKYIDKDNMQEGQPEASVANIAVSWDGIWQKRIIPP